MSRTHPFIKICVDGRSSDKKISARYSGSNIWSTFYEVTSRMRKADREQNLASMIQLQVMALLCMGNQPTCTWYNYFCLRALRFFFSSSYANLYPQILLLLKSKKEGSRALGLLVMLYPNFTKDAIRLLRAPIETSPASSGGLSSAAPPSFVLLLRVD